MKKRVVLTTIVAAMLAVCMLSLTACSTSVEGNTYVFSDITYKYSGDMTDDEKTSADKLIEGLKTTLTGDTFTCAEKGVLNKGLVSLGKWTQDGNKVTITALSTNSGEYTVKGSKLVKTYTYENNDKLTITITYKKAK